MQGVGISRVEVGVGRRSYFVIRVVVLIFSSRIKLATELYSVLLGMFTSRSTIIIIGDTCYAETLIQEFMNYSFYEVHLMP